MKKRILALWVVNYYSGSTSERFVKPLKRLGYEVDVIPLESKTVDMELVLNAPKYDLLLHLPYPNTVRPEIIKSLPIKTIAWNGDDEWFWQKFPKFSKQIAKSHDFCITTFEPALKNYGNGILASWGHSSDWKPKKVKKDIDVYFCGAKTDERDIYLEQLKQYGIKAEVDGPGYSRKIPLRNMIDKYRRAKIGLSFLMGKKDRYYYQVKARTFEIPAVGTFQLSEGSPELARLFNDNEIKIFWNEGELIKKIEYYLKHDDEREKIAKAGHEKNKQYSYEKIFKRCFKEIKKKSVLGVDSK